MNIGTKCWRSALAVTLVAMALLVATPKALANNITPGVVPIDGQVGGLTYGQWSAIWWQRAFSVTTFNDCTLMNQSDEPVWFLAGTTGGPATRFCTVPAGKFIMFPVFNTEWSAAEAEGALAAPGAISSCVIPDPTITGTDDAALLACASLQADHGTFPRAKLMAFVDGTQLQDLTDFRAVSPPFDFTTVAGNPFGLCPALSPCPLTSHAVADGFWIILDPLSTGKYTIHFKAYVPFPEIGFTLKTETTYQLTVQ